MTTPGLWRVGEDPETTIGSQAKADAAAEAAEDALDVRAADLGGTPAVLTAFSPGASDVAIERVSASLCYLYQSLGRQRWWRQELRRVDTLAGGAAPGGSNVHVLDVGMIGVPMLTVEDDAAGVVFTGPNWLSVSNAGAYGGDYNRTTTAGESATYTTPPTTVRVGLRNMYFTNAGLAKVEIDGDATRANLLPTAQDLVTAGAFPNTILVANGGTLNPTDRVLDQYAAATVADQLIVFAEDLTPSAHTVKLTCTGHKRAASSDIRLNIGGWTYALDTTTLDTASTTLAPLRTIVGAPPGTTTAVNSAWEYAHSITPTGASTSVLVGNYHGYELQDSLTFTVDRAAQALVDGQRVRGATATAVRMSRLRHPETGSTDVASVTTTYTMAVDGLRIQHATTWLVATVVGASYPAMLPALQATFDKGNIDTLGSPVALTAHGGAFLGQIPGRVATMWDSRSNGKAAVALYIPDPRTTLNDWASAAPVFLAIQDNSANPLVKIYATRVSSSTTASASAGSTWTSDSYRKVTWLAQGADWDLSNPKVGTTPGTVAAGDDSRITGAAQKSANLSDLANVTAARTNLGAKAPDVQIFTSSGTWTKPAGATLVEAVTMSGGGGGGSGRRGAAGTVRCGGGGGGGGGYNRALFPASVLGATESVAVGAAGAGGAAVTVDDTNGNNGTAGGTTNFGNHLLSRSNGGNQFGSGGTTSSGSGGAASHIGVMGGGAGSNASGSGGVGGGNPVAAGASGGAAGGGISAADAAGAGGAGGLSITLAGGWQPAGSNGASSAVGSGMPGHGGGGGSASTSANGQAGGNGGNYGAGGGGGAASLNGFNSGAGGNGGNGIVVVFSYF